MRRTCFENLAAEFDDLFSTAREQFRGQNSIVSKKTMDAMRIDVSRIVVVKRQRVAAISREKQCRRKTRWSSAEDDAVVRGLAQMFTSNL